MFSVFLACRNRQLNGEVLGWKHKNLFPVSQHVRHNYYPAQLKGHNCWPKAKYCGLHQQYVQPHLSTCNKFSSGMLNNINKLIDTQNMIHQTRKGPKVQYLLNIFLTWSFTGMTRSSLSPRDSSSETQNHPSTDQSFSVSISNP